MYSALGSLSDIAMLKSTLNWDDAFLKEIHYIKPDHPLGSSIASGEGDLLRVLLALPSNNPCMYLEFLVFEPESGDFHFSFGDALAISGFVQRRKVELDFEGFKLCGTRIIYRLFAVESDRFTSEFSKQQIYSEDGSFRAPFNFDWRTNT